MKVIAINGSARKDGNTASLIQHVFAPLQEAGIETEMIQLAGLQIRGCTACMQCFAKKDGRCVLTRDPLNDIVEKMVAADGIILGSPTYFADITAELKALIDRSGMVTRANGGQLRRKVGAGVAVARRGGVMHALQSIQNYFLINEMIIPGSNYWNLAFGRNSGDVDTDTEGVATMTRLGENMAWLLEKIAR
ncbi:flavodoxin family protein [Pelobacter seleniigenes]|uniref:flavodoxin family protein n=1 Tax=Pelobacter seleniigenes TaxID=407188 RepID=UPI0004A6FA88|nr:flavodoxin family protein [Pelobacter seleniigenes]